MTFQIPDWLVYLIAYFTLLGMIYGGFIAPEAILRSSTKRQIGAWLSGEYKGTERLLGPKWTGRYLEFIDNVLVPPKRRARRFPMPGFIRSAGVSLVFATSLAIIYGILGIIQLDPLNALNVWQGWTGEPYRCRNVLSFLRYSSSYSLDRLT